MFPSPPTRDSSRAGRGSTLCMSAKWGILLEIYEKSFSFLLVLFFVVLKSLPPYRSKKVKRIHIARVVSYTETNITLNGIGFRTAE